MKGNKRQHHKYSEDIEFERAVKSNKKHFFRISIIISRWFYLTGRYD